MYIAERRLCSMCYNNTIVPYEREIEEENKKEGCEKRVSIRYIVHKWIG